MNYRMPHNLPEPVRHLTPPETYLEDVFAEDNEIDKEQRLIDRYLDSLND